MKNNLSLKIALVFLLTSSWSYAQQEVSTIRIGTFDSRCVAVAYARSADFMKEMEDMRTELDKAKEEGNKERIEEIEQLGPIRQVLIHQQGFSNGSILNIIDKVKEKLPAIAKENRLNMILSKWEIIFSDESFEIIDVTDQLTAIFNPDEATMKVIENIKAMEPIPIEKISINPMD